MWVIVEQQQGEAGPEKRSLIAYFIRSPAITFSQLTFIAQMSRFGMTMNIAFPLARNIWAHPPVPRDPALLCWGNSWVGMVGNYGVDGKMGAWQGSQWWLHTRREGDTRARQGWWGGRGSEWCYWNDSLDWKVIPDLWLGEWRKTNWGQTQGSFTALSPAGGVVSGKWQWLEKINSGGK